MCYFVPVEICEAPGGLDMTRDDTTVRERTAVAPLSGVSGRR
jgi:hypothetical protein